MLSGFKAKLYAGLGIFIAGLMVVIRVLTSQNSRLRRKVGAAEAEIHRRQVVAENDNEVDEHEQQAIQDIRNPESDIPDDVNEWLWKDKRDS